MASLFENRVVAANGRPAIVVERFGGKAVGFFCDPAAFTNAATAAFVLPEKELDFLSAPNLSTSPDIMANFCNLLKARAACLQKWEASVADQAWHDFLAGHPSIIDDMNAARKVVEFSKVRK